MHVALSLSKDIDDVRPTMEQATFICQLCRAKLVLTAIDEQRKSEAGQVGLNASVFEGSKVDESFVFLNDRRPGALCIHDAYDVMGVMLRQGALQSGTGAFDISAGVAAPSAAAGPSNRALDESFIVLGAASLLRQPMGAAALGMRSAPSPNILPPAASPSARPVSRISSFRDGAGAISAPAAGSAPSAAHGGDAHDGALVSGSSSAGAAGLDAKLQSLAALFELASSRTQVDHPLCLDCAAQLREEIDEQVWRTGNMRLIRLAGPGFGLPAVQLEICPWGIFQPKH